jgi:hypothetical protein
MSLFVNFAECNAFANEKYSQLFKEKPYKLCVKKIKAETKK